ncbi:unnamed protein product, partial [Discosporangium mesarthrocarpum]
MLGMSSNQPRGTYLVLDTNTDKIVRHRAVIWHPNKKGTASFPKSDFEGAFEEPNSDNMTADTSADNITGPVHIRPPYQQRRAPPSGTDMMPPHLEENDLEGDELEENEPTADTLTSPQLGEDRASSPVDDAPSNALTREMVRRQSHLRAPEEEPRTLSRTRSDQSMDVEIKGLVQNDTWIETQVPPGQKAITTKLVYKRKINQFGEVFRYKARLCALGYKQTWGMNFFDTYAPTMAAEVLRMLLGFTANKDWELVHWDIRQAIVTAKLEEEVYV